MKIYPNNSEDYKNIKYLIANAKTLLEKDELGKNLVDGIDKDGWTLYWFTSYFSLYKIESGSISESFYGNYGIEELKELDINKILKEYNKRKCVLGSNK